MSQKKHPRRWALAWSIGYALLMACVIATMVGTRNTAIRRLSTPEALADWQQWRADVAQQQKDSVGVERRVPKSSEPPALVMWRDYFRISLTAAIVFSSVLYWVMAWFVTGMFIGQHARGDA